ncbi:hypothetical protein L7F22_015133 [Adiantum nelumboides]|nr:hypothetical protein [Adiantum nelumboides]
MLTRSRAIKGMLTRSRAIKGQLRRHKRIAKPLVEVRDEADVDILDGEAGFVTTLEHHLILHILSYLDPTDLAKLEATSSIFRKPANLDPDYSLSLPELAALTMCDARVLVNRMEEGKKEELKQHCGGSWKLVMNFLISGERVRQHACPDVVAGVDHSVVLTKSGAVYTFGANNAGQLGHPLQTELWKPRLLSSLDGVHVIQAAAGVQRTLLVTNTGHVYMFGRNAFSNTEKNPRSKLAYPKLVETLCGISIVQVSMGHYFTAVLSQEGKVYTLSWDLSDRYGGHACNRDREPHLLGGALSDIPVVQIAGGICFLLALAYEPKGMRVYSVGCGLGGKLGCGSLKSEKLPCRIPYFDEHTDFKPIAIAAGALHAVALSEDGRVCTWGWCTHGCLGQSSPDDYIDQPVLVSGLVDGVKIFHISAGLNVTFAFADDGDIYCFGATSLVEEEPGYEPKLIRNFKKRGEHFIRVSKTNYGGSIDKAHVLALTKSGKIYASGAGAEGQLGRQLTGSPKPVKINFDFN